MSTQIKTFLAIAIGVASITSAIAAPQNFQTYGSSPEGMAPGTKLCLAEGVRIGMVLSGEVSDVAITGFVNLMPEFTEGMRLELENPFRCSGK